MTVLKWLGLGFLAAVAVLAVWIGVELSPSTQYDDSNPHYADLKRQIDNARSSLAGGDHLPASIDFTKLNNGVWETVCVFGGYKMPSEEMAKRGASISAPDMSRLQDARSGGFRLAEVEEFEVMVAYTDAANQAHFIHFQHGFGPSGQHFSKCIEKPQRVLDLI